MKPRLLWCADAVCHTGFARVTHNILDRLTDRWDVSVLGMNYYGDPHRYSYPIYPGYLGGDIWGLGRFEALVRHCKPDLIMIINDPWIVIDFVKLDRLGVPMVAYVPVDALNMAQWNAQALNELDLAIFYTQFGLEVARDAGCHNEAEVIPHGVDSQVYRPMDKREARRLLGLEKILPPEAFLVSNINRNQPRKRLDLTMQYFAEWVERERLPRYVYLYLHCAQKDVGWHLGQLADYWGIRERIIMPGKEITSMVGVEEYAMRYVYSAADVQITTTMGEGWGLTSHEGMACGIPQIMPDFGALAEWAEDAALFVPCSTLAATAGGINTIGAQPDKEPFIAALDFLYRDREALAEYGRRAQARATESRFSWKAVAARFDEALGSVINGQQKQAAAISASA